MAYTNIDDPSAHFQTKLYTGNGADNHAITNDGNSDLAADLVWIKYRTAGVSHVLYDSSRGATKDYTQILMDKKQHKPQVLNLLTVMVLHLVQQEHLMVIIYLL